MNLRTVAAVALFIGQLLAAGVAPGHADFVVLKTGGEIRGELLRSTGQDEKASPVSIRTLSGILVTVSREDVQAVARRRMIVEQYESYRRTTPDDVESQWGLAEWCRENSLKEQREVHLRRVVELNPEHVAAHRGLGHTQHEGRWASREEIMTSRGYVKHKGKFLLPQELELLKQEERETEAEKAWYKKIKMWHGWMTSDRGERQSEGLSKLKAIDDPRAVPALYHDFSGEPNEMHRLLYVGILTHIQDEKAVGPLVFQSLKDDSGSVRDASIQGISRKDWPKAVPMYAKALKNDLNVIVNRAGAALGEIGDDLVVPRLIDALVTRHRYRMRVPDQQPFGVTPTGQMVPNGTVPIPPDIGVMLLTGQLPQGVQINQVQPPGQELRTKEAVVTKEEPNPSVLAALTRLTGQDFGYQKNIWKAWFNSQKSGGSQKSAGVQKSTASKRAGKP